MPEFNGGDTTTSYGSVSSTGFSAQHRDDVSYNQLQKFWSELPLHARQELLRIDKQTLFEQTRKNMYCSRCNGLLLEFFMQIVMYRKSLQQDGTFGQCSRNRPVTSKSETVDIAPLKTGCNDDVQEPCLHPWGGLTTTRDGTLTVLDCYICSKYLKGLQNVFDSARTRERERELLYPDACGGGGRWSINQGMVIPGKGHGTRETCVLHTARPSVDTLGDFWSSLEEEKRYSLLRMKEEDFMERLMYRFDSKKFCRDCRKNVIREFKELKELKRMRREDCCTNWFCAADTSFQCEVTLDTIHADWHQNYGDSAETYKHYEWAVGTGKGKSDILDFRNVGSNSRVQMNGVDLTGLNSCYITLRAWRTDGRCNEVSVKAHALKSQHCVHGRLVVGDGFVTITRGESIRRFFERAEEVEEEEDDEFMDKDGNEFDGECSRPQKHAKSPELAREFLLDAATVIFKQWVEKAFREGTARQNAHSMFVSLAIKLLEERMLVAYKEVITLQKQCKLLEEEEKEKQDEEERKERRKLKEKEKKLRRKERSRIKEKEKEKKCGQLGQTSIIPGSNEDSTSFNYEPNVIDNMCCKKQEDSRSSIPLLDDFTPEDQMSDYDKNSHSEFNHRKYRNQLFGRQEFENRSRYNKPVRRSNGSKNNGRLHCCHTSSGYTKQVLEPKPNLEFDDVIDLSADVIEPVKLAGSPNRPTSNADNELKESKSRVHIEPRPENGTIDLSTSSSNNSNSDSCSSCLSEGDGKASFSSNPQNPGSMSTSDLEYLNKNSRYFQHGVGGLQPWGPQPLNHKQPVPPVTSVKDHTKAIPIKTKQNGNSEKLFEEKNRNSVKPQRGNNGFSLFHFGGPVDVTNGFKADAFAGLLKEDTDVNVCLKTSAWGDSCGVEEYTLFAANNGIKFSFF